MVLTYLKLILLVTILNIMLWQLVLVHNQQKLILKRNLKNLKEVNCYIFFSIFLWRNLPFIFSFLANLNDLVKHALFALRETTGQRSEGLTAGNTTISIVGIDQKFAIFEDEAVQPYVSIYV